ncbi:hypothetical protein [Sneathiella chinensis]|uniref:hypothetical protein n=1 Tax=Sneathiella chinensis TaxID=349750 RepID=UPI0019D03730|nr:hypothetical protein [Sneathiella chinensis]
MSRATGENASCNPSCHGDACPWAATALPIVSVLAASTANSATIFLTIAIILSRFQSLTLLKNLTEQASCSFILIIAYTQTIDSNQK